jgi:hypothetical protein
VQGSAPTERLSVLVGATVSAVGDFFRAASAANTTAANPASVDLTVALDDEVERECGGCTACMIDCYRCDTSGGDQRRRYSPRQGTFGWAAWPLVRQSQPAIDQTVIDEALTHAGLVMPAAPNHGSRAATERREAVGALRMIPLGRRFSPELNRQPGPNGSPSNSQPRKSEIQTIETITA